MSIYSQIIRSRITKGEGNGQIHEVAGEVPTTVGPEALGLGDM